MLKKEFRLTKNYDFQKVKKYGQRVGGPLFLVNYLKTNRSFSRFGFIATKTLGNAVIRHRAQRLLREAVQLNLNEIITGYDVVVLARLGLVGKKFQEVEKEMRRLLGKAGIFGTRDPQRVTRGNV